MPDLLTWGEEASRVAGALGRGDLAQRARSALDRSRTAPTVVVVGESMRGSTTVAAALRRGIAEGPNAPEIIEATADGSGALPPSALGAEALVVAVAANSALSMSELSLLDAALTVAHVPRILVVLTKTDLLDPEELDQVVTYATSRLKPYGHAVSLVTGSREADPTFGPALDWLVATLARPGRDGDLRTQHVRQLADVVGDLAVATQERATEARQESTAAEAEHRAALTDELIAIDELRLDLGQRQARISDRLRTHMDSARDELAKDLTRQLTRAAQPAQWWEKELPEQLRAGIGRVAQGFETTLVRSVEEDTTWLRTQLRDKWGIELGTPVSLTEAIFVQPPLGPTGTPTGLPLPPMAYRLGPAGVLLVGGLLIPGIGPIAAIVLGIVGGVAGEYMLRGAVGQQRKRLAEKLSGVVARAMADFVPQVAQRLSKVYDDEIEALMAVRRERKDGRPAAAGEEAPWSALQVAAETLRTQVSAAAGGTAEGYEQ